MLPFLQKSIRVRIETCGAPPRFGTIPPKFLSFGLSSHRAQITSQSIMSTGIEITQSKVFINVDAAAVSQSPP